MLIQTIHIFTPIFVDALSTAPPLICELRPFLQMGIFFLGPFICVLATILFVKKIIPEKDFLTSSVVMVGFKKFIRISFVLSIIYTAVLLGEYLKPCYFDCSNYSQWDNFFFFVFTFLWVVISGSAISSIIFLFLTIRNKRFLKIFLSFLFILPAIYFLIYQGIRQIRNKNILEDELLKEDKKSAQKMKKIVLFIVIVCVIFYIIFFISTILEEKRMAEREGVFKEEEGIRNDLENAINNIFHKEENYLGIDCNHPEIKIFCEKIEEFSNEKPIIHTSEEEFCLYFESSIRVNYHCIDVKGSRMREKFPWRSGYCDGNTFLCPTDIIIRNYY